MAARKKTKARARPAPAVKPRPPRARPARAALGNDPFTRGAAVRTPPQAASAKPPPAKVPLAPAPAGEGGLGPTADVGGEGPSVRAPSSPASSPVAPTPADERALAAGADAGGEAPPAAAAAGDTDYAAELGELAQRLLPALRERASGLVALRHLAEPGGALDAHGMDPTLLERAAGLLDFLYLSWWRVEAAGAADLPPGPVVVVANHGGDLPWDALVLRLAVRRETAPRRDLRPLLDAAALDRPFSGRLAARLGAIPATPENALAQLAGGGAIGVFPEGSGPHPWSQRYRIGAFGRGGFAKLALRAGAAIVPCAIVGSEEASAPVGRAGFLADALGLPVLGAIPGLPLGPFGALPLPSRWTLRFGEPVPQDGLGPEAAGDADAVARITATTRDRLQALLDETVAARRSTWL